MKIKMQVGSAPVFEVDTTDDELMGKACDRACNMNPHVRYFLCDDLKALLKALVEVAKNGRKNA